MARARGEAVREGVIAPHSEEARWAPRFDFGPRSTEESQHNDTYIGGYPSSERRLSSSLDYVENRADSNLFKRDRAVTLNETGVSEAGTALSQINIVNLKMIQGQGPSSHWFSHQKHSVQLQDPAGNPRSKAWDIQVYATESQTGPRLYVHIYHEPHNPYQFPPLSPAMNRWQLVWKVECSKRLLRSGGTSTLAATLDLSRKANDTRIKELGLNQRDRQIMNFALDKVADGDPDGNLEAQPWKSFLALCKNWEKSGGWREHKALEANRKGPLITWGDSPGPKWRQGWDERKGLIEYFKILVDRLHMSESQKTYKPRVLPVSDSYRRNSPQLLYLYLCPSTNSSSTLARARPQHSRFTSSSS